MNNKVLILLLILSITVFHQCGTTPDNGDNGIDLTIIKTAPPIIELDGREYFLDAYLWRDFMPISPRDGKEMVAVIKIIAGDSLDIPPAITSDRMWVINGELIWATGFSETQTGSEYELIKVARNGPKWGPGIKVDVVVELKDENNRFYLKTSGIEIHRTD